MQAKTINITTNSDGIKCISATDYRARFVRSELRSVSDIYGPPDAKKMLPIMKI